MWKNSIALLAFICVGTAVPLKQVAGPSVSVKNGTYVGIHSSVYGQDFFLGIPFAKPPVGDLRFHNPQSLNTTWTGVRSAQDYSAEV
jgi:carboxylesterase type B